MITETDEIALALDEAARTWPHARDNRSRLLHLLLEEGRKAVGERAEQRRQQCLTAIRKNAGALTGVYQPGYLDELRGDWPE